MEDLLLLHGAIGAKGQWDPLVKYLDKKYRVHRLNFSGHGGTPFPAGPFSIAVFANDVLSFLREKKIGQVNIFGYSMGGYVAMYLAKYHPGKVGRIITLATKFHWDEDTATREIRLLDPDGLSHKVPRFASELEELHLPNDWKTVLAKTREMLIQLGQRNTLVIDDYTTISAPCLLLLGEKDRMITREETLAVHDALPDAQLTILENTPHPLEQVDMGILSLLIEDFIPASETA